MSLINDALKRATRNQPTTAAIPAPEPAAPMQPVEYRSRGLPWYFVPAVLAILAAACWFIVKGMQTRRQSADPAAAPVSVMVKAREPMETPATPSAASIPVVEAPLTTAPAARPTPPASTPTSTETSPPAAEAPATTPAAAPEPVEPSKPAYKLQGIFFRPANPSAMVNGKTVSIGSRIDGATVKAITRDTLTIELNGQTTVLTLN